MLLKELIHCIFKESAVHRTLFRVDAGRIRGLSFGHASRCLVLARALSDLFGSEITFLMRDYEDGIQYVLGNGQNVKTIPATIGFDKERERIVEEINQFKPDWLVVDLPYEALDVSFFSDIKYRGTKILFIDEFRFISPDVDVILNSNILAAEKTKKTSRRDIRYFLGPEYFIFGDEHITNIPPKKHDNFLISISFGGSDPTGLTMKTLGCLSKRNWERVSFRVILGPGYKGIKRIKEIAKKFYNTIEIIVNPENIYPYFLESNLVICSGGRTLYELSALNIPALAIASIEHEATVIKRFKEKRLIPGGLLSWDKNIFLEQFQTTIFKLLNSR